MAWTTQEQLREASLKGPAAADSLYDKGKKAGIADNDKASGFVLLTNEEFLGKLVEANQLTAERAKELQKTVSAGYPLADEAAANKKIWKNVQTAMFFSSLPETYAYSDIAQRLVKSGQLSNLDTVRKRLEDTGAYTVLLVTGMGNGEGKGLHSAFLLGARHDRLSQVKGDDGLFLINQASMGFTLLTFSTTPFAAVNRIGEQLPTAEHQRSWLAMWNVIGSLMGIEEAGLPATVPEASALDDLFRQSAQWMSTAPGQQLITVLVEYSRQPTAVFYAWAGAPLMKLLGVQLPQ